MEDTKAIRREVGPMEWLDDGQDLDGSALQADVGPPSSGHSIDPLVGGVEPTPLHVGADTVGGSIGSPPDEEPPRQIRNACFFRHKAEEYGDLAAEMAAEGLDGTAYGAARKAAHYGHIANDLYGQRAEELKASHPEWFR